MVQLPMGTFPIFLFLSVFLSVQAGPVSTEAYHPSTLSAVTNHSSSDITAKYQPSSMSAVTNEPMADISLTYLLHSISDVTDQRSSDNSVMYLPHSIGAVKTQPSADITVAHHSRSVSAVTSQTNIDVTSVYHPSSVSAVTSQTNIDVTSVYHPSSVSAVTSQTNIDVTSVYHLSSTSAISHQPSSMTPNSNQSRPERGFLRQSNSMNDVTDQPIWNSNASIFRNETSEIYGATSLCHGLEYPQIWVRHPKNCSIYVRCSNGQAQDLKHCQDKYVFSLEKKECVAARSALDDCDITTSSVFEDVEHGSGEVLNWHPKTPPPVYTAMNIELKEITPEKENLGVLLTPKNSRVIHPKSVSPCSHHPTGVYPHPDNCAWYYNCSVQPDAIMEMYHDSHIQECPYPQLFSVVSLQCEDFEVVECQGRKEPMSPCDYRANDCYASSHCIPCWVRYASCVGLEDGLNPWPELEWHPFFVECYRQRTVFQGACDKSSVFSPLTRACETPYSIPREHGGWRPSCEGRRNGKYPDEHGRCELFYVCESELFGGFHSCTSGTMFDPATGSCQDPSQTALPCGDLNAPNFCLSKPNGQYADAHGRCTHYYRCYGGELQGVFVCPEGVFNPRTRMCDSSSNVVSPCGTQKNHCLNKEDGYIKDETDECSRRYHLCERGLHVAAFSCEGNTVFADVTKMCEVADTLPPCQQSSLSDK